MATPTIATNNRRPAADVIFPGQSGPEITTLRVAWANLMDTGRMTDADSLYSALYSDAAGAVDQATAIEEGLAEIAAIERHGRKIVDAATQRRFEAHVNECAKNLFPRGGRAGQIFVDRALAIGWGGDDPIGQARREADAYLKPGPLAGLGNKTSDSQKQQAARRHNQLKRIADDRALIKRTGTGSNGS